MNDFQERIDLLSDKDLLKVISAKDDYQQDFWDLAIENAEKRGLTNQVNKITEQIQSKKERILQEQKKELSLTVLYSERAIITFSTLFTSIAGSILFSYNLKTLNREGRNAVLAFGVLYTFGIIALMNMLPFKSLNSIVYLLNLVGGFIITLVFGDKYYPEKLEYKNKKIWKALIISLLITAVAIVCIIWVTKHLGTTELNN